MNKGEIKTVTHWSKFLRGIFINNLCSLLSVLEINSAHVEANFLLGLLSSQTNDLNDAFSYYLKVIENYVIFAMIF